MILEEHFFSIDRPAFHSHGLDFHSPHIVNDTGQRPFLDAKFEPELLADAEQNEFELRVQCVSQWPVKTFCGTHRLIYNKKGLRCTHTHLPQYGRHLIAARLLHDPPHDRVDDPRRQQRLHVVDVVAVRPRGR